MVGKISLGKQKKIDIKFIILVGLFFLNIFKFLALEGSDLPIPSSLFNMIVFLGLIVFWLHKEGINKNDIQTTLDYYFKREKNN